MPKIFIEIIEFVIQNQFKGCSLGILGVLWLIMSYEEYRQCSLAIFVRQNLYKHISRYV